MSKRAYMLSPCENCPYRIAAPRQHWHRSEFENVLRSERSPIGSTFACHKQADLDPDKRGWCAGWLLDQKKRGVPSVALRVLLATSRDAARVFECVSSGGHRLFANVLAMCRANGVVVRPVCSASMVVLDLQLRTPSNNEYARLHHMQQHALHRDFEWAVLAELQRLTVRAPGKTWPRPPTFRVRVTVYRSGINPRDVDNAYGGLKPLLDALRKNHLIADDDMAHIEVVLRPGKSQWKDRTVRTRVVLEPSDVGTQIPDSAATPQAHTGKSGL
jgi:hypothetical protein